MRLLISIEADSRELVSNLSKYISMRKVDFQNDLIEYCYIVFDGNAVRVNAKYQTRREIEATIDEIRP